MYACAHWIIYTLVKYFNITRQIKGLRACRSALQTSHTSALPADLQSTLICVENSRSSAIYPLTLPVLPSPQFRSTPTLHLLNLFLRVCYRSVREIPLRTRHHLYDFVFPLHDHHLCRLVPPLSLFLALSLSPSPSLSPSLLRASCPLLSQCLEGPYPEPVGRT